MKMKVIHQKVQWKPGKRFKIKVDVAHRALEAIRKKHRRLEPSTVVAEAERSTHPLHSLFVWDNDEAADRWRNHQARNLINSIEVVYQEQMGNDGTKTVSIAPCYVSDPLEIGYLKTDEAIEDIDTRALIVAAALAGLRGWKERYGRLKEMAEIVEVIQKTEQRIKTTKTVSVGAK